MWKRYEHGEEGLMKRLYHLKYEGIMVRGDPTVPPTRWWNHLYLLWFGWKQVAVFRAPRCTLSSFPYRIGYRNFEGEAFIRDEPIRDMYFRMRIGHEDVTFFAIDHRSHHEVPFELVKVTAKNDPEFARYPLY